MERGASDRVSNHRSVDRKGDRLALLTLREMDVLREIATGRHADGIGRRLKITPKTVDVLRYRLMKKLDIHDRVQLALFAIGRGVVAPPDGWLGRWGRNNNGQALIAPELIADLVDEFGSRESSQMRQIRRFPLSGCQATAHLDGGPLPIQISDISVGGVGFTAERACQVGLSLTIEHRGSTVRRYSCRCRVVRACRESCKRYQMGAVLEGVGHCQTED